MQKVGSAFSLFITSPSWTRFTAGVEGTHRHKSQVKSHGVNIAKSIAAINIHPLFVSYSMKNHVSKLSKMIFYFELGLGQLSAMRIALI